MPLTHVWLDVACPECKVGSGKFCLWTSLKVESPDPHDSRLRVFRAALDLKNELEK